MFRKYLPLVLCLSLTTPACGLLGAKDPSAIVQASADAVYDSLVVVLDILDTSLAGHISSIQEPLTIEQVAQFGADIEHLVRARTNLLEIKSMLDGTEDFKLSRFRAELASCVTHLNAVVESLKSYGVAVPDSVIKTLDQAMRLLG